MTLPNYSVNPGKWLGLSIASTLLCCLPLGIPGIVFAAMAMASESRGDYGAAQNEIDKAKTWTTWSFAIGLLAMVLAVCLNLSSAGSDY